MGFWDTDYRPTSKRALCNVLEQVIRAGGGLFKGYSVRRFRRYVEDGMMPGAAKWSQGIAGEGDISAIREEVKDLTDIFINAWFSVNPKE